MSCPIRMTAEGLVIGGDLPSAKVEPKEEIVDNTELPFVEENPLPELPKVKETKKVSTKKKAGRPAKKK